LLCTQCIYWFKHYMPLSKKCCFSSKTYEKKINPSYDRTLVSDRKWFRPKVSAEYSAETEYLVTPAKTESQNSAFLNIKSKKMFDKKKSNILE
jgi:hypothetical protein